MLTLNDGRSELWQWDTGRTLAVDADCSQVHFSNKVFGRSIDVDVADGVAIIPDVLLQTDKDLNVWAFVGTAENGYTKISKTFKVNRRNKPADYVFTPTDQITLQTIQRQIGDISDLTTEAKENLVAAINEAAASGGSGSMDLRVADGYVQYSTDGGSTWKNLIAMADLKGEPGAPGKDGHSPVVTATKSGKTTTISVDGASIATVEDGADGAPGSRGSDGITPTIGQNGNWFLGEEDTGKPSRGADGATGATGATGEKGADGKSAYAYAVDGGYTGTEAEFAEKLASDALIVHVTGANENLSADKTYADIRDAILAGISVFVEYNGFTFPLIATISGSLFFGTIQCANDGTDAAIGTVIIQISEENRVYDVSATVEIPKTLPNPNALTFTGAVTGRYDGSAPLEVAIPSGGGGITVTNTAAVGQTVKITAVDENGQPTEWEAVDFSSGGDAEKRVRHIATVAVTTGTTSYSVTADSNGDALNLESVYILTEKFWGNNGSYVQVDVNGKVITKAFGQSGSPQVLELEKMGELQKFTNIQKPSDVGISFGDYYNGNSAVTSVGFWSATSNVNTTIEIYGVDA